MFMLVEISYLEICQQKATKEIRDKEKGTQIYLFFLIYFYTRTSNTTIFTYLLQGQGSEAEEFLSISRQKTNFLFLWGMHGRRWKNTFD